VTEASGVDRTSGLEPEVGRERAAHGEVGADVEAEQHRAHVCWRLRGEQHGCREIVGEHGAERGDHRGGRGVAQCEQSVGAMPGVGEPSAIVSANSSPRT
jgi:hypothetical protein